MKRNKLAAAIASLACIICLVGLPGCSDEQAASPSTAAAPAVSDEEAIRQDCIAVIGTSVSAEQMTSALRADSTMAGYAEQGFDLDAYARNLSGLFSFSVVSVKVDGDTATAKCTLTVPDYGEPMQVFLREAVEEKGMAQNVASMTENERAVFLLETMSEVMTAPGYPTAVTDIDIDYLRENGTWQMKDRTVIEEQLSTLGREAAGLG